MSSPSRWVLVTGANKGIGFAIVQRLLEQYADVGVLLGSRSAQRGHTAAITLTPQSQTRVEVVTLDVSDDVSVSDAAAHTKKFLNTHNATLFGLVNNAGMLSTQSSTKAEMNAVNVYGIKRVCDAFVPLLQGSSSAIVNVTSASGPCFVAKCNNQRRAKFTDPNTSWSQIVDVLDECTKDSSLSVMDAYGVTKACANAYTMLLARQLPQVRIHACTPGFIETDMTSPMTKGRSAASLGMKLPPAGAVTPVTLLMSGVTSQTGQYFGSDGVRSPLDCYRAPGDAPFTDE